MKLKHFLLRLAALRIGHDTPCPDAVCALGWIKLMEFISRENYKKIKQNSGGHVRESLVL